MTNNINRQVYINLSNNDNRENARYFFIGNKIIKIYEMVSFVIDQYNKFEYRRLHALSAFIEAEFKVLQILLLNNVTLFANESNHVFIIYICILFKKRYIYIYIIYSIYIQYQKE